MCMYTLAWSVHKQWKHFIGQPWLGKQHNHKSNGNFHSFVKFSCWRRQLTNERIEFDCSIHKKKLSTCRCVINAACTNIWFEASGQAAPLRPAYYVKNWWTDEDTAKRDEKLTPITNYTIINHLKCCLVSAVHREICCRELKRFWMCSLQANLSCHEQHFPSVYFNEISPFLITPSSLPQFLKTASRLPKNK